MAGPRDPRDWLLERGGPVIRHRTATELSGAARPEPAALRRELLRSPLVRRWLGCLRPGTSFNELHGSPPTALENALGRLTQLGVRAGARPLDVRARPLREWLARSARGSPADLVLRYRRNVAAKFLLIAGYRDTAVLDVVLGRLKRVSDFCRRLEYDVYVDPAGHPGYPRAFSGRPLLDPALCPEGETPLPSVRDLHAFAALREEADTRVRHRIEQVARYVADPRYAGLAPGYGVSRLGPRRFWAIGWEVRLPERPSGLVLLHLELLARFETTRRMPALRRWVARLERYRTPRGTWLLPRAFLPSRPGYWVAGADLALEEARRTRLALELESTFYVLRIQSLLAGESASAGRERRPRIIRRAEGGRPA